MKLKFWKKEKPKELTKEEKQSKAIADGLEMFAIRIADGIIKAFLIVILMAVLFFVGLYAYGEYQENKKCEEQGICFGGEVASVEVQERVDCKYPKIDCVLVDVETNDIVDLKTFCGWQEAKAWKFVNKEAFIEHPKKLRIDCYEH